MQEKPAPPTNLLALPDGTELVGDYRIKRVLGAGGFGITYLADEKALARLVTIKEYFPADLAARQQASASPRSHDAAADFQWGLDRFIEEAQTLARFDHPNIVRVHRYFRSNNTAYMVLHFEEGGSFKAWLRGLKRAPRQAELDAMIAPLLDALELIHRSDYLHRDIAPDNVMVRKDGSPVLIDFGSARGEIAAQSRTVSALVKPGYSPYEQYATTSSSQGPWTDIYALGATLYHAIAGKRPPDAPSRVVNDEYIPAKAAALGSYRSGFLDAIDKALKIEVGERPQSIAEWRGLLFAPDPKRERVGIGNLPIVRKLGQLRTSALAGQRAADAAVTDPTVARTDTPSLVPVPPDAPQPRGQLLDFIDALKKRTAPAIPARKKKAAKAEKPASAEPAPSDGKKVSDGAVLSFFGLGRAKETPQEQQDLPAKRPAKVASRPPAPKRAARRAQAKKRRRWRLPSRRWRSVIYKVAAALAIASLAVAYRESWPRTEARMATVASSEGAETGRAFQLIGHKGRVTGAATADHGRWIVSGGADATLRIWSASSGALIRTIELAEGAVTAIAVSDRHALSGHAQGLIVLWDLERGEKLGVYNLGKAPIVSLAFASGDAGFVAAGHDGAALFETRSATSAPQQIDAPGPGLVVSAARSRGILLVGGAERTIHAVRFRDGRPGRTYRSQAADLGLLSITDDGRYLAAVSGGGSVQIWISSSSWPVRMLRAHDSRIAAMAFGPERLLGTAAEDGDVKLWNVRSGRLIHQFRVDARNARPLGFSGDGRFLFGASQDGTIQVWPLSIPSGSGAT
jgi:serine/threonine protein kinase